MVRRGGDDAHPIVPAGFAAGAEGFGEDDERNDGEDDAGDRRAVTGERQAPNRQGGAHRDRDRGGNGEEEGRDPEAAVAGLAGGDARELRDRDDHEGHIARAGGVEDEVHQPEDAERDHGQRPVAAFEDEGNGPGPALARVAIGRLRRGRLPAFRR